MSGWPNRAFAIFSMIWVPLIIAALAFAWLARGYMLSPDTGWREALIVNAAVLGAGGLVWCGFYRLICWFDERS